MTKRVFICGYLNFPRGSAAANYIQYLIKGINHIGHEVILISNKNEEDNEYLDSLLENQNDLLTFEPITLSRKKLLHYFEYKYFLAVKMINLLKKYGATSDDLVLVYSSNLKVNKGIIKYVKKHGIKSAVCVVEWFNKEYFGENTKAWMNYQNLFNNVLPKYDVVIPISKALEDHFKEKHVATCYLPIMADTAEFEYVSKNISDKKIFVYPANGRMKDALKNMLNAFAKLNESELLNIEVHFTGIKEKRARELLTEDAYEKIRKVCTFHGWLSYMELARLYDKSHFLLLAREISQMTLSNFPSKVPEVMSHGVIPIASNVGDYTTYYLIDGLNSIVFDGSSDEDICNAIRRAIALSNSDVVCMSQNANRFVKERLDYHVWESQIKSLIEDT